MKIAALNDLFESREVFMKSLSDGDPCLIADAAADDKLVEFIGQEAFDKLRTQYPKQALMLCIADPLEADGDMTAIVYRRLLADELARIGKAGVRSDMPGMPTDRDTLMCKLGIVHPSWEECQVIFNTIPLLAADVSMYIFKFSGGRSFSATLPRGRR